MPQSSPMEKLESHALVLVSQIPATTERDVELHDVLEERGGFLEIELRELPTHRLRGDESAFIFRGKLEHARPESGKLFAAEAISTKAVSNGVCIQEDLRALPTEHPQSTAT
jgi:hypothetical protein